MALAETVTPQRIRIAEPDNPFALERGGSIAPVDVAFEIYGRLNAAKTNAILLLHAFSGDAHAAGMHPTERHYRGWWDEMVGPGAAFDTDRYCVICSNVLGGCRGTTGPGSPHPIDGRPWGARFPDITIGDIVRVQAELIDALGIERLHAVAGGSMGGMQALDWIVRFPDRVGHAVIMASTARLSAQAIAFNAVGRNAIESDPAWRGGDYYEGPAPAAGLAIARMVGHITYLSSESMRHKFGRRLQRDSSPDAPPNQFAVESYLTYQGEKFVDRFDANTYLTLTRAMDTFDLGAPWGGLDGALARVEAASLVLSYSSDWLFPTAESKEIVFALARLGKRVSFHELGSPWGHDSFLLESGVQADLVRAFLGGPA